MSNKMTWMGVAIGAVLACSTAALAAESKAVCMKNGSAIEAKGGTTKEKEEACRKQGGTWEHGKSEKSSSGSATQGQKSGGGGGW